MTSRDKSGDGVYKRSGCYAKSVSMSVPPLAGTSLGQGTQVNVPPGYTINGQRVPNQGIRYQPGAARTHYEKPRVLENRPVTAQEASRYRQYFQKYHLGEARNVGRTAETSFSNPPRSGSTTFEDIARNTEGIRQRQSVSRQTGRGTSSEPVRTNVSNARPPDTRINIEPFEMSDTVPLLGTTGASAGLSGSEIAAGLTVTGGALGLGAITSAVVDRIKNKGAVLPGTDYVGPGNEIKIDAPRSGADAVAKDHDIAYDTLTRQLRSGRLKVDDFVKNIQRSDDKAIKEFAEWYDATGDWDAFVGKYGLGLKRWIEGVVGHVYPFIPGKCLGRDSVMFHPTNVQIGPV